MIPFVTNETQPFTEFLFMVFIISFQENCKDFEELRWYESLIFYGFKEGEVIDKEDDDVKLLPAIVDKILLPKLSGKCLGNIHHYDVIAKVIGYLFTAISRYCKI